MNETTQISAVIPTYNRAKTLSRAIDSVFAQSYPVSEVVIVDDGSTDNTRDVVKRYRDRIRYVYQPNAGVASARNRLVNEARFDWIAFLDSDDYWLPDHIKRMVNAIEFTKGEAALYFADIIRPPDEQKVSLWEICQFKPTSPLELSRDAGDWVLTNIQPMMLQASVIRREKYHESGALPENLRTREDTLLFLKFGLLFPLCAVQGCGTVMMSDGGMRLTKEIHYATVAYALATIAFLKEVLALRDSISGTRRRHLKEKLSDAYFGAGRAFYRQNARLTSMRYLLHSALVSRKVFMGCLRQSARQLPAPFRRFQRLRPVNGKAAISSPDSVLNNHEV
jgi:glycosyltransferase involved in cell wall biosynthesis